MSLFITVLHAFLSAVNLMVYVYRHDSGLIYIMNLIVSISSFIICIVFFIRTYEEMK